MLYTVTFLAKWVWETAMYVARWLVFRKFTLFALAFILPWALRGVIIWVWNLIATNDAGVRDWMTTFVAQKASELGFELQIEMTGVGGYLAQQTGLLEYCSIIITGWGLYWFVGLGFKSLSMMRSGGIIPKQTIG
jgi:hypothetical protein